MNGFYADVDDEIRDAEPIQYKLNATEGLDVTARLMAWSDTITKLHNKGAIIDGERSYWKHELGFKRRIEK